MNRSFLGALGFSVAFAVAGCGASQPPISALGAIRQANAIARHASRDKLGSDGYLYVSSIAGYVYVYSYPEGKLVTTFKANTYAGGECVDSAGDVFITTVGPSYESTIFEYAHGGTTPIASLSDPGLANGCAIDATTSTLAVMNSRDWNNPYTRGAGDLAVYTSAEGQPAMYYVQSPFTGFLFGAYDDTGNLYLSTGDGAHPGRLDLLRLSPGSTSFEAITVSKDLLGPASVQWDGKYITYSSSASFSRESSPLSIYRLRISGTKAKVVGTTVATAPRNRFVGQTWIQDRTLIAIDNVGRGYQDISFWPYPRGGKPQHNIRKAGGRGADLYGVVLSFGNRDR